MNVELHYGKGFVTLRIPDKNIAGTIRPCEPQIKENSLDVITKAISKPITDEFVGLITGKRLAVLVPDGTRDLPYSVILPPILPLLKTAHSVLFIVCTGTHNSQTVENNQIRQQILKYADNAGIKEFVVHIHDCEGSRMTSAGITSRGTEVFYNDLASRPHVFLVFSDVKCHYFAGYSNPLKNFVPGICSFRTAEQNHSLALDKRSVFGFHPWHPDPARRVNPLAEDMFEVVDMILNDKPAYAVTMISVSEKIQWACFDKMEKASAEAFLMADQMNTYTVVPTDRLIVSPGGFPNDETLYIAQRALELTKTAVKNGGEVLFISECANGIGSQRTMENFYNRLVAPIPEILASIKSKYKLFSHKPYKFAQMIQNLRRIWVYTQIPDEFIINAHLAPTADPQAVVDNWLQENPHVKINIIDGANKIAIYPKTDQPAE